MADYAQKSSLVIFLTMIAHLSDRLAEMQHSISNKVRFNAEAEATSAPSETASADQRLNQ